MQMQNLLIYFLTGGVFTTLIVVLEESRYRLWSGFAALVPIFTLVSYIFIGQSKGGVAVSEHSKFVLAGTLISWVPYMVVVAWLSPKIGPQKAIAAGMGVFFVLAMIFLAVVAKYRLFS